MLDSEIEKAGGFDSRVKLGFAVITISGEGAEAVNLQGIDFNTHGNETDVAMYDLGPRELRDDTNAPPSTRKTFICPHVFDTRGNIARGDTGAVGTVIEAL